MSSTASVRARQLLSPARRSWIFAFIALIASAVALNWESAALKVSYAQGGLVAAYSFDEGAGSIVNDASGLGNNGVIAGALWTASGRHGRALSFADRKDIDEFVTLLEARRGAEQAQLALPKAVAATGTWISSDMARSTAVALPS